MRKRGVEVKGEVEGVRGRVKGKWKEEEGEQKEFFAAFYEEEGIGMGRRERWDLGGSG
jgi:hypothetical protein